MPSGLHVLHMYTRPKMSSNKVSVVVRNMSESPIFLRKGVQVAQMVSTSPVPLADLSLKMEATLGTETVWESMSVTTHQEKHLEKLNLDGLSNWTPWNAMAAKELVLAFHDIFPPLLEQVCTSLRDMLDVGAIHPARPCGVMQWCWCRRRMDHCNSGWTSTGSMHTPRRTHTPCEKFRKHLKVW